MINIHRFPESLLVAVTAAPGALAAVFTLFLMPTLGGLALAISLVLLTLATSLSARTMVRSWFQSVRANIDEQVSAVSGSQKPLRNAQVQLGNQFLPIWSQQIETARTQTETAVTDLTTCFSHLAQELHSAIAMCSEVANSLEGGPGWRVRPFLGGNY